MITKRALFALAMSLAAIGCSNAKDTPSGGASVDVNVATGDIVLGDKNASIQIIEYASTTCGHCAAFNMQILPAIKEEFIATGKANLVFRDLPTAPAQVSAAGGALARCAGEDKYYDVLDDIFESQRAILIAAQNRSGAAVGELVKIGARHGLSEAEVMSCFANKTAISEINRTESLATADKVDSTPTLFINGERVPSTDMSLAGIRTRLNAALGIKTPAADTETEAAPVEEPSANPDTAAAPEPADH